MKISQRWAEGVPHDPRSVALFKSLAKIDFEQCGDYFCWKSGGDGDNGETLMYELDIHFELEDAKHEGEPSPWAVEKARGWLRHLNPAFDWTGGLAATFLAREIDRFARERMKLLEGLLREVVTPVEDDIESISGGLSQTVRLEKRIREALGMDPIT